VASAHVIAAAMKAFGKSNTEDTCPKKIILFIEALMKFQKRGYCIR
jgi:hypothetical protein